MQVVFIRSGNETELKKERDRDLKKDVQKY